MCLRVCVRVCVTVAGEKQSAGENNDHNNSCPQTESDCFDWVLIPMKCFIYCAHSARERLERRVFEETAGDDSKLKIVL